MSLKQNIEKELKGFSERIDSLNYPYVIEDMTTQILTLIQKEREERVEKAIKQIDAELEFIFKVTGHKSGIRCDFLKQIKQTLTRESNE